VQVGTPQPPPPPQIRVIETERVVVHEARGEEGQRQAQGAPQKQEKRKET
jgi:hypothetical protein